VQFFFASARGKSFAGWFVLSEVLAVTSLLVLTQVYTESITIVTYQGVQLRVPYVPGFEEPPTSCTKCPPGVSNEECILGLPTPALIASCFGETRIRHAQQALLYSYLGTMLFFGTLVGFITLGGAAKSRQKAKKTGK